MNTRIEELAEQAGTHYRNTVPGADMFPSPCVDTVIPLQFLEKFAELIARECAGIYSKIDNGNLHLGTDDYLEALNKTFWNRRK